MQTKKQIRQAQIGTLQKFAQEPTIKQVQEAFLLEQLLASPYFKKATVIGVTLSQRIEVTTQPIIEALVAADKQVVVPKTLPDRQMAFYPLTATTQLEKSHFGALEPVVTVDSVAVVPELMIVPGLAFTTDGWRVGFGGGYYDRYLEQHKMPTVALALKPQQLTVDWPIDAFDVQIDQVILA